MIKVNIGDLLLSLVPNARFSFIGNPTNAEEYDSSVNWMDQRAMPDWQTVMAAIPICETAKREQLEKDFKRSQYQSLSDPIFFKYQRGEKTREEWLAIVKQIHNETVAQNYAVMYPGLVEAVIPPPEPEPTFADLTKRDEPPIVDP